MRTSTRTALIVLICCAIALGLWYSRPHKLTDTEQIQSQIQAAVRGANRRSVGEIMSVISSSYEDENGLNADSLRFLLGRAYRSAPDIDVTMSPPIITITGDTAVSDSTLTIRESPAGRIEFLHPIHLEWRKEKSLTMFALPTKTWRIVEASYGPSFADQD